ncbi:MAG: CPBP family intramembrane glutamic endopeptidase [Bacteroidota bacterium]
MFPKRTIYLLALFTLVGFPLIGWVIHYFFSDENWQTVFENKIHPFWQLAGGIVFGFLTARLGWLIVRSKLLSPVRSKYEGIIGQFGLSGAGIVFVSFCAGTGEELLFRAAIQPQLGIIITSIGFVALHGYLNPFDWRVSLYGLYLTLVIGFIGWMFEEAGIWFCISAHTVIDIVLLRQLVKSEQPSAYPPAEETGRL